MLGVFEGSATIRGVTSAQGCSSKTLTATTRTTLADTNRRAFRLTLVRVTPASVTLSLQEVDGEGYDGVVTC